MSDTPTPSSISWLIWAETPIGEVTAPSAVKAMAAARETHPAARLVRVQSRASYAVEEEQARIAARHVTIGLREPPGREVKAEGRRWDPRTARRRAADPATDPEEAA